MGLLPGLTLRDLRLFADIVARLERLDGGSDARAAIFEDIVDLIGADYAASYVWSARRRRFEQALNFNMDESNLRRYEQWFQFRDPITFKLRARRKASPVEAVISRRELFRTEFYNDFLARDGLHHGVNLFLFDNDRDLGDFRIWRARGRPDFGARELGLLDALTPVLQRALSRRGELNEELSPREREVACLVARGCTDRDIARMLEISFGTVRTHLSRALKKTGCANRAELAAAISVGAAQRDACQHFCG